MNNDKKIFDIMGDQMKVILKAVYGREVKEEKEQCFCKSIYNGETKKVENCTCGKCADVLKREPIAYCDYCQTEIYDEEDCEEGHIVGPIEDSLTMCEGCYENLQ